jgi:hypothetical protein
MSRKYKFFFYSKYLFCRQFSRRFNSAARGGSTLRLTLAAPLHTIKQADAGNYSDIFHNMDETGSSLMYCTSIDL